MKAWEVMEHKAWMNDIPSTLAFECKRFLDGLIQKLKSQFCDRGDCQIKGVNFFDTYAPVVDWQIV
jgi:hypothetical protein